MTPSMLEIIQVVLYIAAGSLNAVMCYQKIQDGNKDAAIAWLVAFIWSMNSARSPWIKQTIQSL